jgi:hypothetical protein
VAQLVTSPVLLGSFNLRYLRLTFHQLQVEAAPESEETSSMRERRNHAENDTTNSATATSYVMVDVLHFPFPQLATVLEFHGTWIRICPSLHQCWSTT